MPLRAFSLPCSGWDDEGAGVAVNVSRWWEGTISLVKLRSTLRVSKRRFNSSGGSSTAPGLGSSVWLMRVKLSLSSVKSSPFRRGRLFNVLAAFSSC